MLVSHSQTLTSAREKVWLRETSRGKSMATQDYVYAELDVHVHCSPHANSYLQPYLELQTLGFSLGKTQEPRFLVIFKSQTNHNPAKMHVAAAYLRMRIPRSCMYYVGGLYLEQTRTPLASLMKVRCWLCASFAARTCVM